MGATGAIYALRRALWRPLPADTILDDVLAPMRAVLAASRVVFSSEALAFDPVAPSGVELRRKIRTLAGNYQILRLEPRLLNPFRNPVWIQYMSHKVGRLLVPYALMALLVASAPAGDHVAVLRAGLRRPARLLRARRLRRLSQPPRSAAGRSSPTRPAEPTVNALIKGTTTS